MTDRKTRIYLSDAEKARLLRVELPAPATPESIVRFRSRNRLRVRDLADLLRVDRVTAMLWERPYVGSVKPRLHPRFATVLSLALCELERRLQAAP